MGAASRLWRWVRLGRPHFLLGGFLMHVTGAAMAGVAGYTVDLTVAAWCQLAISATQLSAHYANDYFDIEADRNNLSYTLWSGGSRVLPGGLLAPRVALISAVALTVLGLAASLPVAHLRPGLFPLVLVAAVSSWSYSAPPLRLHSSGAGEPVVAAIVTLLTPATGYYAQAGMLPPLRDFLYLLPLTCIQVAMLLVIELPDAEGDARSGKRTLVVRLGEARAIRLLVSLLLLPYAGLPFLLAGGLPGTAAAGLALSLLPALSLVLLLARSRRRAQPRWEWPAFLAVATVVVSAAGTAAGWLWALNTIGT